MFKITVAPDAAVNTINSLPNFMLKNLILAKHLVSLILPAVANCVLIYCFILVIRASTILSKQKFRISLCAFISVHIHKSSNLESSQLVLQGQHLPKTEMDTLKEVCITRD